MTSKVVNIKQKMPNDCCGGCVFAHNIAKQDYLLCMVNPPFPVTDATDDGVTWERGAAVDATDPRCYYFVPKGRA
jgi:hypothetical protein